MAYLIHLVLHFYNYSESTGSSFSFAFPSQNSLDSSHTFADSCFMSLPIG